MGGAFDSSQATPRGFEKWILGASSQRRMGCSVVAVARAPLISHRSMSERIAHSSVSGSLQRRLAISFPSPGIVTAAFKLWHAASADLPPTPGRYMHASTWLLTWFASRVSELQKNDTLLEHPYLPPPGSLLVTFPPGCKAKRASDRLSIIPSFLALASPCSRIAKIWTRGVSDTWKQREHTS